ncbi:MAG: cytochrome c-type biogenesis protein CcmH [Planctomycetes bacterium]|nr:cytochrome c-type biogenesis protein CcmH [Planctomycetota bacterium]
MAIADFGLRISDWRFRAATGMCLRPKCRVQNAKWAALLFVLFAVCAPVGWAQSTDRSPAEAERLYHEVGDQLFCICGCRENLLTCSHNTCSAKDEERAYLRELTQNPKFDAAAIKQGMADRFGNEVLQVQQASSLYPILAFSGIVLVAAFGAGFWVITRREETKAEQPEVTIDPEMEARIANELKELD